MTNHPLPSPSRTCILLLTGFVSNKESLYSIRDAFQKLGYSTFISNFWGETYVEDFSVLTIDQCVTSMSTLIDQLSEQYDCIVGIGISISGAILIEYAKTHTNHLDYIVSIGTPFKIKNMKLIEFGFLFYPLITWLGKIVQRLNRHDMLPILASHTIVTYFEEDFPKNLEKVTTPVFFMHGEYDSVSDGSVLPQYIPRFSSEKKEMIWVSGADHVINYNVDVIVGETLAFIKK